MESPSSFTSHPRGGTRPTLRLPPRACLVVAVMAGRWRSVAIITWSMRRRGSPIVVAWRPARPRVFTVPAVARRWTMAIVSRRWRLVCASIAVTIVMSVVAVR